MNRGFWEAGSWQRGIFQLIMTALVAWLMGTFLFGHGFIL